MGFDRNRSFDPADPSIARVLKAWVGEYEAPRWIHAQQLMGALQGSDESSPVIAFRLALRWTVASCLELLSILIADESPIFSPSRDSYCWNPPHLSPCDVQSRVRDTYLLGAGLLGAMS